MVDLAHEMQLIFLQYFMDFCTPRQLLLVKSLDTTQLTHDSIASHVDFIVTGALAPLNQLDQFELSRECTLVDPVWFHHLTMAEIYLAPSKLGILANISHS